MNTGLDIQDIKGIIKRRKNVFIISFLSIFMVGVMVALVLTPIYTSEATIRIEDQQLPENLVQSTITDYADERIRKISQEILSRPKLLEIIDRFDLYPDKRDKASPTELVQKLRKSVELTTISAGLQNNRNTATVAFTLSFEGEDPVKVHQVTETLSQLYLEEDIRTRAKFISGTTEFLQNELQRLKKEIDDHEKNISDFKQIHLNELPDDRSYNLSAIARLERALDQLDMRLRTLQEQRVILQAQVDEH